MTLDLTVLQEMRDKQGFSFIEFDNQMMQWHSFGLHIFVQVRASMLSLRI